MISTDKFEELNFINVDKGVCHLKPIVSVERLKEVLQNTEVVRLTTIGDTQERTISETRAAKLVAQFERNIKKYGLGFYEIYTENLFLGIAGFFCIKHEEEMFPEICVYLLPLSQAKGIGYEVASVLIDYAFKVTRCRKVIADAFANNHSTKIIYKLGFVTRGSEFQYKIGEKGYGQIRYELTREIRGLFHLSQIIIKENSRLIPIVHSMTKNNIERVRTLWYTYFHKGICLSNGGVKDSFIQGSSLQDNNNLRSLHMYRSDRSESTTLTFEAMAKFLIEEGIPSIKSYKDFLSISFSFGSHEGFARIIRCLYHPKKNNGMFYPTGGYGILAALASTMKPKSYNVHLVDIDKGRGEKIVVSNLITLIRKHPTSKMLFIDLKTTAGAIYNEEELLDIIRVCKKYGVFLLADVAHINMEFNKKNQFPDVIDLCLRQNFHDFGLIYTTSKTYGLERARIGFFILSKKNNIHRDLHLKIDRDLYRVIGSGGDLSFEIANLLINSELKSRQEFIKRLVEGHRFNLNLMLGYLEGVNTKNLDEDLRSKILDEIPKEYRIGIRGLKLVYKPEGGIHLKINTQALQNKFFYNIRIFNAEIFSYALNKVHNVVSLHSYQIMDPEGFGMRLSFSIKEDIKMGMQAIHNFVKILKDQQEINPFLPHVYSIENIIFPSHEKINRIIHQSRQEAPQLNLYQFQKDAILKAKPAHLHLSDKEVKKAIDTAARKIQFAWKVYKNKKSKLEKIKTNNQRIVSKL